MLAERSGGGCERASYGRVAERRGGGEMWRGKPKIQLSCKGQQAPLLLRLRHLKVLTITMSSRYKLYRELNSSAQT